MKVLRRAVEKKNLWGGIEFKFRFIDLSCTNLKSYDYNFCLYHLIARLALIFALNAEHICEQYGFKCYYKNLICCPIKEYSLIINMLNTKYLKNSNFSLYSC